MFNITATGTRGIITTASKEFCHFSQIDSVADAIGKPHNISRHPDMPKGAFADLWAVLQAGGVWQGIVCSRGLKGKIYWVKATVFPVYENGRINGYISIRVKPDADQIREAIDLYRKIP